MPGNTSHNLADSILLNMVSLTGGIEKAWFHLHIGVSKYHPQCQSCCGKWVVVLYFYSNQSLMVINLWRLDQYKSKHTSSQTNMQANIRQKYKQTRMDDQTNRKDIRNYMLKWRNPGCHGTLDIDDTCNWWHILTYALTQEIYLVQTHLLIHTWRYLWYDCESKLIKSLDTRVRNQATRRYLNIKRLVSKMDSISYIDLQLFSVLKFYVIDVFSNQKIFIRLSVPYFFLSINRCK